MTYIRSNISRSKGDHTVNFSQLMKYNKIFFFEESYIKFGGEASLVLHLFYKKSVVSVSVDQKSEML